MSDLEPPTREGAEYHQCVCLLVDRDARVVRDKCPNMMVPMDQAFCDSCEEAGHPGLPQYRMDLPERSGS